jgi:hypothetical protein
MPLKMFVLNDNTNTSNYTYLEYSKIPQYVLELWQQSKNLLSKDTVFTPKNLGPFLHKKLCPALQKMFVISATFAPHALRNETRDTGQL